MKIEELEACLERDFALLRSPAYKSLDAIQKSLFPPGYRARISLYDSGVKPRKKKRNASADNWSPKSGEIRISFEPDTLSPSKPAQTDAPATFEAHVESDPVVDLVRVLDAVESRPGYNFVALKWFRDTALPEAKLEWAASEPMRQTVLRSSIDRRLVLTSRVQNPKAPQFPTTAIRLNRILPEVKTMLGDRENSIRDFEPVSIRGESLSETVLRERR
ncbi:MAG: hypothetical protein ABSG13_08565 [Bryobacteraceae bacterium]|jgi:hypothetical protein